MAKRTDKSEVVVLGIRMPRREMLALERVAETEDRPVSTQARKILSDWLRKRGALKEPAQ